MSEKRIYMFWGGMDLMYILVFLYGSLSQGRIPIYDDYRSMLELVVQYGDNLPMYLFACSLTLVVSITYTVFLFFSRSRTARLIAYTQIPLRLFLVVPSLSFIPWLLGFFEIRQAAIGLSLLLLSEVVKVFSLYRLGRAAPAQPQTH